MPPLPPSRSSFPLPRLLLCWRAQLCVFARDRIFCFSLASAFVRVRVHLFVFVVVFCFAPPAAKLGGGLPPGCPAVPVRVLHGHRGVEGAVHRPADAPPHRAHPVALRHGVPPRLGEGDDAPLLRGANCATYL